MMGSLQRPLVAAAAFAIASASVSTDLSDKFSPPTTEQSKSPPLPRVQESNSISVSKFSDFSFLTRLHVPPPNTIPTNYPIFSSGSNTLFQSSSSSPILLNSYRSAELAKTRKQTTLFSNNVKSTSSSSEVLYKWHLPETTNEVTRRNKKRTVVVLLGWLGAKQKHLKRYAEWYTSRGFHVITFTFPMAEILSYKVGGKAEEHVHLLANHLSDWLEEEEAKNMVFHTFSNTGWLTYGAILEKFQEQDPSLMGRIKGCIVDSAPVAAPDPQVWASGFSAAVLKKQSVATKGLIMGSNEVAAVETKPAVTEAALLLVLEKFFEVVLNLPTVSRRLSDVLGQLSSRQPTCPQLYIYSSADRVIPVSCVESFIEEQRRSGHEVRSCDFVYTPHVDHFRNDPQLYTNQLTQFLEDCVLTSSK